MTCCVKCISRWAVLLHSWVLTLTDACKCYWNWTACTFLSNMRHWFLMHLDVKADQLHKVHLVHLLSNGAERAQEREREVGGIVFPPSRRTVTVFEGRLLTALNEKWSQTNHLTLCSAHLISLVSWRLLPSNPLCHMTICVVCFLKKPRTSHLLLLCVSNVLKICEITLQIWVNSWILSTFSNAPAIKNAFHTRPAWTLAHISLSLASRSSSCCLLVNLVWGLSSGRFTKAPWIPPFSQTG